MISGLWNGISGLSAFEKALSTQSNNIANTNTIGHKSDRITFEDMMYESRYGKGVAVQSVEKDFSQGGLKETGTPLDVAIEGKGFFVVNDPNTNETYYTRAGNFKLSSDGTLRTVDDLLVYGSSSTVTNLVSSDDTTEFDNNYSVDLVTKAITTDNFSETINAKSTDYLQSATESGTSGNGYKDRSAVISDVRASIANYSEILELYSTNPEDTSVASTSQQNQIEYSSFLNELQNEDDYIEVTINGEKIRQDFDTDTTTTMNLFADKISAVSGLSASVDDTGLVTIDSLIPGQTFSITQAAVNNNAPAINETIAPSLGSGIGMLDSARQALKSSLETANAKFLEMTHTIPNSDAALTGISSMQLRLDNLNVVEDVFGELSIEDGNIYAKDGDNKFLLGKLETAYFANENGLNPKGDRLYTSSNETGDPVNASNINKLVGSNLELSNSDFGESLVDLMVFQRAFEGSSKSITTSDEFLKTAIQLKT